MDAQLSICDLLYHWPGSNRRLKIDRLELMPGERVILRGASASGKSTLLNLIAGVVIPNSGQMTFIGHDLMKQSAVERDRIRAEYMGIIFQQLNLLPYLSVHDNIVLPLIFAPNRRQRVHNPKQEVRHLLEAMELSERLLQRPVTSLSVGQQQRVAVARALMGSPPLILADEPTSALDPINRDRFMGLLLEQCQIAGSSLILVSHDPELAQCVDEEYVLLMDQHGTEVQPC